MNTRTIVIPEQVYVELVPVAAQEDKNVEELVNEVLRRYLWEARERQMDREMEAYRAMHTELKQRFQGQYLAIYNRAVIDSDADRITLSKRVRQQYGHAVVFITQVAQEPERELMMRSPRFERGG